MKKTSIFLIVFYFCIFNCFAQEENVHVYDIQTSVSDVVFYDINEEKYEIADFQSKPIVMFYWSRNCVPCVRGLDELSKFAEDIYNTTGAMFLMISSENEWKKPSESQEFIDKYKGYNLQSYLDKNNEIGEDFAIFSTPRMFLISPTGGLIAQIKGKADWDNPEVVDYIKTIFNNAQN
ncbi:MAG: TlpA disulfide reductase family protein [Alphaproteobacteria bacterium]